MIDLEALRMYYKNKALVGDVKEKLSASDVLALIEYIESLERNTSLQEININRAQKLISDVREIADGWVGFDDSHHYGDTILKVL